MILNSRLCVSNSFEMNQVQIFYLFKTVAQMYNFYTIPDLRQYMLKVFQKDSFLFEESNF